MLHEPAGRAPASLTKPFLFYLVKWIIIFIIACYGIEIATESLQKFNSEMQSHDLHAGDLSYNQEPFHLRQTLLSSEYGQMGAGFELGSRKMSYPSERHFSLRVQNKY